MSSGTVRYQRHRVGTRPQLWLGIATARARSSPFLRPRAWPDMAQRRRIEILPNPERCLATKAACVTDPAIVAVSKMDSRQSARILENDDGM